MPEASAPKRPSSAALAVTEGADTLAPPAVLAWPPPPFTVISSLDPSVIKMTITIEQRSP